MGSAIGQTLLQKGHEVVAYNRTALKAQNLPNASFIEDPFALVCDTSIIFSCLFDFSSILSTLDDFKNSHLFKDKYFISITSTSSNQSRELGDIIKKQGGYYMDVGVISHANSIPFNQGSALISGPNLVYQELTEIFSYLFPLHEWLGSDSHLASAFEMAYGCFLFMVCGGMGLSLKALRNEKLNLASLPLLLEKFSFFETLQEIFKLFSEKTTNNTHDSDLMWPVQNQVKTLSLLLEHLNQINVDGKFLDTYKNYVDTLLSSPSESDFTKIVDVL